MRQATPVAFSFQEGRTLMNWADAIIAAWAANLVAFLNACAAVVVGIYTVKLTKLNRILTDETRKTKELRERANVVCAIEPHQKGSSMLELVIANQGESVAHDVIISSTVESPKREGGFFGPKELQLASLLAGGSVRAFVGTGFDLGEEAVVHAKISYRDTFGTHEYEIR
jgi:hypothetical protein